jgi:heptosyltransferase-2
MTEAKTLSFLKKIEKPTGGFFLSLLKYFIVSGTIQADSIDHTSVKNILVVIRHQMGDFLCASPMVRSLRNFYPEAKITLVTKASTNYDMIFKHDKSFADDVFYFEYGFESFINLVKDLQNKKFDIAVIPSTVAFSSTNHLLSYYSKARIRVGVNSINYNDNKVAYLLNVKNDFLWESKNVHQIERNLDIIRQINVGKLEKRIRINLTTDSIEFAKKFYSDNFPDKNKSIVGFHPGAGKPQNVWSPENFAALAYKLSQRNSIYIFISEGPSDKEYVEKMTNILLNKYNISNYVKHKGSLMNNLALISQLNLFITNDTGIMHLASGIVSLKLIALFGPTEALQWGPIGEGKYSIQSHSHDINKLSVESVFDICESAINN